MQFTDYTISYKHHETSEVCIFRLKPKDNREVFDFLPGQFCQIKNPFYKHPDEPHLYSIASSPTSKNYLEICMKVYGSWTHSFVTRKIGEDVQIAGPFGKFVWDETVSCAAFLAAGIGIVPFVSMLRSIHAKKQRPRIVVLYANKTHETIMYKRELESVCKALPESRVVHVLSRLKDNDPWQGHRGRMNKKIIESEVDLAQKPTFFICGTPAFVQAMKKVVAIFSVPEKRIKFELFNGQ